MSSRKASKKKSFGASKIIKPAKLHSFGVPRISDIQRDNSYYFVRDNNSYNFEKVTESGTESTLEKSLNNMRGTSNRWSRTSAESKKKDSELSKQKKHFIQSPTGGEEDKKRLSIKDRYVPIKTIFTAKEGSSKSDTDTVTSANTEITTRDMEINQVRRAVSDIMDKCEYLKEERRRLKDRQSTVNSKREFAPLKATESEEEVIARFSNERASEMTERKSKRKSKRLSERYSDHIDEMYEVYEKEKSIHQKALRESAKRLVSGTVNNAIYASAKSISRRVRSKSAKSASKSVKPSWGQFDDELMGEIEEKLAKIKQKDKKLSAMNESLKRKFSQQNGAQIKESHTLEKRDSDIEKLKKHINEISDNMEEMRSSSINNSESNDENNGNDYFKRQMTASQQHDLDEAGRFTVEARVFRLLNENKKLKKEIERQSKQIVQKNATIHRSVVRLSDAARLSANFQNFGPEETDKKVAEMQRMLQISNGELKELKKKYEILKSEMYEKDEEMAQKNEVIDALQKENERLLEMQKSADGNEKEFKPSKQFEDMMRQRNEKEEKLQQQIERKNQMIQDSVERLSQISIAHKNELEEMRRQSAAQKEKESSLKAMENDNRQLIEHIDAMKESNERLSVQNVEYGQKMIIMDRRITQKDGMIKELRKKMDEMEDIIMNHRRQTQQLVAVNEELKNGMNEREIEKAERKNEFDDLMQRSSQVEQENNEIKADVKALRAYAIEINRESAEKHEQIIALERRCTSEIDAFKENEQKLQEKNAEIESLNKKIAEMEEQMDETKIVIKTLKENNEVLRECVNGELEDLKRESSKKDEKIAFLSDELEKEEGLNEQLNRELDEAEQIKRESQLDDEEIKLLTAKISTLESDLNERKSAVILLKQQIVDKNEIIAEKNQLIEEEIRNSEQVRISIEGDEKMQEQEIQELCAEVQRLSEQKAMAEQELVETDKIFKQRFIEFKQIQSENGDLQNKIERMSGAIMKKDEIIDRLQEDTAKMIEEDIKMMKDMKQEKEVLSAKHSLETARISKDIIDSKDKLVNDLKERLKESHDLLKEKDVEISNMNEIIRHLQEENSKMIGLPDVISKNEAEILEKDEKISQLEEEKAILKNNMEEMMQNVRNLEEERLTSQNEKEELMKNVDDLEQTLIKCENKRTDDHLEMQQSFEAQNAHKNEQLEELRGQMSQMSVVENERVSELSEKVNEKDGEIEKLRKKLKKQMAKSKQMESATAENIRAKESKIKLMDEKVVLMNKKGLKMKQVIKELKAWNEADIKFKDDIIHDLRNQIVVINENLHKMQVRVWKAEGKDSVKSVIKEKENENENGNAFDMDMLNEWMVKLNEELEELRAIKRKRSRFVNNESKEYEKEDVKEEVVVVLKEKVQDV